MWRRVICPRNGIRFHREFSSEIFVGNMSFYTSDEEFEKMFSQFGRVEEARLMKDPKTKRPKGFGFVTYASEAEAEKAIKSMGGRIYGGRIISVEHAKSRSEEGNS